MAKKQQTPKTNDPMLKTISGSRKGLGEFKTEMQRTTVGGISKPFKYKTTSIDTAGYGKGKKTYSLKTTEGSSDKLGLNKVTSKKKVVVARKDVPSVLKSMKKK